MMGHYEELSKPFDKKLLKTLSKGGANLTYVPVSEVIARLNDVLGLDGWSYKIIERWWCGEKEGWPVTVMAHVQLTIHGPNGTSYRDGIGGVTVKFAKSGQPIDLGDEWKGAVSDALKKAAQAAGVALDLARTDEALALGKATQPIDMDAFGAYCASIGVDPLDVIAHAALDVDVLLNEHKPILVASAQELAQLK